MPLQPTDSRASKATSPNPNASDQKVDRWPTPPTPEYLIPRMGKLPVSSTTHFQTMVMNKLEAVSASDMSARLYDAVDKALSVRFQALQDYSKKREWVRTKILSPVPGSPKEFVDRMFQVGLIVERDKELNPADMLKNMENWMKAESLTMEQVVSSPDTMRKLMKLKVSNNRTDDSSPPHSVQELVARLARTRPMPNPELRTACGERWLESGKQTLEDVYKQGTQDQLISVVTSDVRLLEIWLEPVVFLRVAFYQKEQSLTELSSRIGLEVTSQRVADAAAWLVDRGIATPEDFINPKLFQQVVSRLHSAPRLMFELITRLAGFPYPAKLTEPAPNGTATSPWDDIQLPEWELNRLTATGSRADVIFNPPPSSLKELQERLEQFDLNVNRDFLGSSVFAKLIEDGEVHSWTEALDWLFNIQNSGPIDILTANSELLDKPAEGVLLYQEQGWYARGLGLGNLLQSVALAPGEVTQVAMTHWNHTTRATDSETESQDDSTSESDTQNRSVTEIQQAAAAEHSSGGSVGSSSSESAQGGYAGFGFSVSAGSSNTLSTACSYSDGSKNMAMAANQQVAATTGRQAEAARTRRASMVREISQSEDQSVSVRVVANYNHMHALTVMYFEVIEVYDLKTRVVDADRLIFLPFSIKPILELLPRFRSVLVNAAKARGKSELAEALNHLGTKDGTTTKLDSRIKAAQDQKAVADAEISVLQEKINALRGLYGPRHADIKASLDRLASSSLDWYAEYQFRQLQTQDQVLTQEENAIRDQLEDALSKARSKRKSAASLEAKLAEAKRIITEMPSKPESDGAFQELLLFLNQAAWLSLSPGEVLSLARFRYKGEILCEWIDPSPVGITGHYVAYRWRFSDPIEAQRFKREYVEPFTVDPDEQLRTVSTTIAVPTGGVFGEAVLGQGVSAEKIDLSRFWNWKDSPIPILPPGINPITAATASIQNVDDKPMALDPSSAKLGKLQDLPAPSGFSELAGSMRAQMFRDMSGISMLQSLAEATTKAASDGATNAGQAASDNFKAGLNFVKDIAPQVLSTVAAPETGGASLMGGMMNAKEAEGETKGGATKEGLSDLAKKAAGSVLSDITDAGGGGKSSPSSGGSSSDEPADSSQAADGAPSPELDSDMEQAAPPKSR